MKKRTRSHVVRLELEGDVGRFCEALRAAKWVTGVETRAASRWT